LRELALFAGAGGGILGAKLLGWKTVCAVELDRYRSERLAQRQNEGFLPPFPIWNGDIKDFDGRPWKGIVDVVSGGFPCQDISAANPKAEGITGARSGLWQEMRRIVREVEPRFVFVENSPMLVSRGLGVVLSALAEMGYDAVWGVMGADDIGAFHRRERLFILGYNNSPRQPQQGGDDREKWRRSEHSGQTGAMDHTDRARLERQPGNESGNRGQNQTGHTAETGIRVLADSSGQGLFPTAQTGVHRQEESRGSRHVESERHGEPMANSSGEHRGTEHEQCFSEGAGARQQPGRDGEALENSDSSVCDRGPENEGRGTSGRITLRWGGPDCLWGDVELIHCKDGKLRATKPGLHGMATRIPNRVDRISAVGDSQVPAVVAAIYQILSQQIELTCEQTAP
jgi:DNA (cytosine-5)-methyltransferase 1